MIFRTEWARYFKKNNIKFIYWSANFENLKLQGEKIEDETDLTSLTLESQKSESSTKSPENQVVVTAADIHIYTREELLKYFADLKGL